MKVKYCERIELGGIEYHVFLEGEAVIEADGRMYGRPRPEKILQVSVYSNLRLEPVEMPAGMRAEIWKKIKAQTPEGGAGR